MEEVKTLPESRNLSGHYMGFAAFPRGTSYKTHRLDEITGQ